MPVNTLKCLLFLLIVTLLSSSCNNMQVFRMDVLKPGYVVVPSQKTNIVIVDNTGIQPKNVGHVVKVGYKVVGDTTFNTEPLSGILINSLSRYLLKEGFYQQISPIYRNELFPAKNGEDDYLRSARLSSAKLHEISKDTSVHLLISMDRLITKTTTNTYYTGETYSATRDVWVNSVWRVYDLDADTVVAQFQYNDSLYWRKNSNNSYMVTKLLPELEVVLPEIGDVVAENVHPFLGPHWVTEKREYFCIGSYRMKLAADLVRKDQMDQAAALWELEYHKGYLRSKYRAAINMMLNEEVKGHPEEALAWEEKAEVAVQKCPDGGSDYDIVLMVRWKGLLKDRIQEMQKLKIYFDGNLN